MLIATLVTGENAVKDVRVLLRTLDIWHPDAQVYIDTDTPTKLRLDALKTRISLHVQVTLDAYAGLTRSDMEARNGRRYASLFHDFTMEKLGVVRRAAASQPEKAKVEGIWLLDADLTLLAPLPTALVASSTLRIALSPHMIRPVDEAKFGKYNAGMVWIRDLGMLDVWARAALGSRFFEQAALEDVAHGLSDAEWTTFPIQDNFGWWRFFQSVESPPAMQKRQGIHRMPGSAGMTFDGQPLRSLHTHWYEPGDFNTWMLNVLKLLAKSHRPAKLILDAVTKS